MTDFPENFSRKEPEAYSFILKCIQIRIGFFSTIVFLLKHTPRFTHALKKEFFLLGLLGKHGGSSQSLFVVGSCLVLIQWFTQQKLPSMPISKSSDKNAKDTQVFGLWPGFREVGIPAQTETHTHTITFFSLLCI